MTLFLSYARGSELTRRKAVLLSGAAMVSACAPRGSLGVFPQEGAATTQSVWAIAIGEQKPIAVHGSTELQNRTLSRYARFDISIPPGHELGKITWPREQVDPDRHFYVAGLEEMADIDTFLDRIAAQAGPDNEVTFFIHGYNTNYAEAVYRHAQIAYDFSSTGPQVSIIWPSSGSPTGYLTDRDSALIARDRLEQVLIRIAARFRGRTVLVAHSMGAFLVMETLRQMAINGTDVTQDLTTLILISPDIRIDVFQSQVARIERLPEATVLIVSERDRALLLSAQLAGGTPRLGSPQDIAVLSDMDLLVIDLSDLSASGQANHLLVATSPAAVSFLKALGESGEVLQDRRRSGLQVLRVPVVIPR